MHMAEVAAPIVRPTPPQYFSDLDLQLCRRLDWRFLLPNSDLGNVAYLGNEKTSLAAALERFSRELSIFSATAKGTSAESGFDLVVVTAPSASSIDAGARLLKNGGAIYVEVGLSAKGRTRGPAGWRADLATAGFEQVQPYWHRPNFKACREIVPLDNELLLNYVLTRSQAGLAAQMKSAVGRFVRSAGLLPFAVPCFSLVGQKSA
jgi:hypothetical protein